MMIVHAAKPLFACGCLEESPSLQTIKDLPAALPEGKLLNSLRAARGKGRDDYPVLVTLPLVSHCHWCRFCFSLKRERHQLSSDHQAVGGDGDGDALGTGSGAQVLQVPPRASSGRYGGSLRTRRNP
jgi:hypothetical protein